MKDWKIVEGRFEYGVILNGSQTYDMNLPNTAQFEYGVILNGSQTHRRYGGRSARFEYGVILNGSQTTVYLFKCLVGLSMV